jgi:SAM-dependent methyltransferase
MSLSEEYKRHFAWRSWSEAMDLLPPLEGKVVLDLGCGIGDQAAELSGRGARMIGIDAKEELLATARSRKIPNAEFRRGDLRTLRDVGIVDGIWSSFAAAYVPELAPTLAQWRQHLNPDGWVALVEIDNLFGHEPMELATISLLEAYARDALDGDRYDFHMGGKLRAHLERAGFTIADSRTLADRELSFDGPAGPDVLESWNSRLERMHALKRFCGERFEHVRMELLATLSRDDHRSLAKVYSCVGRL